MSAGTEKLLADFATRAHSDEAAARDEAAQLAWVSAIQHEVWGRYCKDTLPGRERVWNVATAIMAENPPHNIQLHDNVLEATWKYAKMSEVPGRKLTVLVGSTLMARSVVNPDDAKPRETIAEAIEYIEKPKKGLKCPEELLGVYAEGWRLQRTLSPLALKAAVGKHTLRHASSIQGETIFEVPGQPKTRETRTATLLAEWHQPTHPPFYMRPENLGTILGDIMRWNAKPVFQETIDGQRVGWYVENYRRGQEIPEQAIEAFLRYPGHCGTPDRGRYVFYEAVSPASVGDPWRAFDVGRFMNPSKAPEAESMRLFCGNRGDQYGAMGKILDIAQELQAVPAAPIA